MQAPTLTVAILAGGAASRLGGRDKGLEPLGGRLLIERLVDYCARHVAGVCDPSLPRRVIEVLIIANRHLDDYARFAPVHTDIVPGFRGPLAGVASALGAATASVVLTLPVDCPAPPHDLATRLLAAMDRAAARAVVAHDGERRQPLFAIYRSGLAGEAAAAAMAGRGVWEWQDALGAIDVDFSDQRRQFHNLNTPEDFAAYADASRVHD